MSCWINLNLCIFTYMDHSLYVCKILCFHRISWKMSSLYQPHNIVAFLSCLKWNYFLLKSHLKKSSFNFNLVKTFYMITNIMGNKKYFRFISRYSVYIELLNILQLTLVISNSMGPWKKFESTVVRLEELRKYQKCSLFNDERETTRAKFWRSKTSNVPILGTILSLFDVFVAVFSPFYYNCQLRVKKIQISQNYTSSLIKINFRQIIQ